MPPQRPIHVADHARFAAAYTVKAVASESDWQYQRLPEHLRSIVFPASKH